VRHRGQWACVSRVARADEIERTTVEAAFLDVGGKRLSDVDVPLRNGADSTSVATFVATLRTTMRKFNDALPQFQKPLFSGPFVPKNPQAQVNPLIRHVARARRRCQRKEMAVLA